MARRDPAVLARDECLQPIDTRTLAEQRKGSSKHWKAQDEINGMAVVGEYTPIMRVFMKNEGMFVCRMNSRKLENLRE